MKRLTVLALLLTAACSSSPDEPSPTPAPQDQSAKPVTPGSGNGGTAKTGGNTATPPGKTDDKPVDKPADPAPVLKNGTITLTQTTMKIAGTTNTSYSGSASFIDASHVVLPDGASAITCTKSTESGCDVTVCDIPKPATPPPTTPPPTVTPPAPVKLPSAGAITVDSNETFTLSPDDNGLYGAKTGTTTLLSAGKDVTISAAGAEIPKFEKTFKAPSHINVTKPEWPAAGAPLDLDRSKDFVLEWSDAHSGEVGVTLSSITADKLVSMVCNFTITDGTATIPAATLGKLVTGGSSSLSVDTHASDALDVDGWHIVTIARRPGQLATGMMAATQLTVK